jgi:hypothetical protein
VIFTLPFIFLVLRYDYKSLNTKIEEVTYMTYKVSNPTLAGKKVAISTEEVQFDELGVGEIQSEEIYTSVLSLANFHAYEKSEAEKAAEAAAAKEAEEKAKADEEAAKKAEEEAKAAEAAKTDDTTKAPTKKK